MSVQLWTYLRYDSFGANLVGPVAAGLEESATPPLHHPAAQPAKQEKFARAGGALALVTYKKFIMAGRRWRWSTPSLLRHCEEESFLAAPGFWAQAVPTRFAALGPRTFKQIQICTVNVQRTL
jgi:hypothetical protein